MAYNSKERTQEEKIARKAEFPAVVAHVRAVLVANIDAKALRNVLDGIKSVFDAEIQGQYYKGGMTASCQVIEDMYWEIYGDGRNANGESHVAPTIKSKVAMSVQPLADGSSEVVDKSPKAKVVKPTGNPELDALKVHQANTDKAIGDVTAMLALLMEKFAPADAELLNATSKM